MTKHATQGTAALVALALAATSAAAQEPGGTSIPAYGSGSGTYEDGREWVRFSDGTYVVHSAAGTVQYTYRPSGGSDGGFSAVGSSDGSEPPPLSPAEQRALYLDRLGRTLEALAGPSPTRSEVEQVAASGVDVVRLIARLSTSIGRIPTSTMAIAEMAASARRSSDASS